MRAVRWLEKVGDRSRRVLSWKYGKKYTICVQRNSANCIVFHRCSQNDILPLQAKGLTRARFPRSKGRGLIEAFDLTANPLGAVEMAAENGDGIGISVR